MMSSAIPARLLFQCGHAALVTLPRVKGESSAQRNERIAQEKSAALARHCDFCAPAVAIVASSEADQLHAGPVAVAELAHMPEMVVANEVELIEALDSIEAPVEVAEVEDVLAEEPVEVLEVTVVEPVAVADVVEVEVLVEPVALVGVVDMEELAEVEELVEPATPAAVEPEHHTNGFVNHVAKPKRQSAKAAASARTKRFVVEYQVERILRAADIHDALRQATALGASQLLAIVREDT